MMTKTALSQNLQKRPGSIGHAVCLPRVAMQSIKLFADNGLRTIGSLHCNASQPARAIAEISAWGLAEN
jgi:hypothetical protein